MSTPVPCTAQVLLVLSADGKGIVMRPGGLRPATRRAAEGKRRGRGAAAAVERTIPFMLACQALAVCWYATAGHHPADAEARRRNAPW